MSDPRTTKFPLLPGLAFVLLYAGGWALGVAGYPENFPPSTAELVAYFEDHAGTAMAASILTGLAAGAWIWFVATARPTLRRAEGGDGRLSDVAAGGGLVAAAVVLASTSARFAPAIRADEDGAIDPAVATGMGDLQAHLAGAAAPLAFGVFVLAFAIIALRHGLLGRWAAWVTLALGAALVLPAAPWVAIMVFPFWVLGVTITLRRRRNEPIAAEMRGGVASSSASTFGL